MGTLTVMSTYPCGNCGEDRVVVPKKWCYSCSQTYFRKLPDPRGMTPEARYQEVVQWGKEPSTWPGDLWLDRLELLVGRSLRGSVTRRAGPLDIDDPKQVEDYIMGMVSKVPSFKNQAGWRGLAQEAHDRIFPS